MEQRVIFRRVNVELAVRIIVFACVACCLTQLGRAQTTGTPQTVYELEPPQAIPSHNPVTNHHRRPRVGVVLGGGGAAGVCHVGVLQELEAYGIPVDCIAGTSMGSIVAGLYATGMTAKELEQIVHQFRWHEVMAEPPAHHSLYERRKTDDYLAPPAITLGLDNGKVNFGRGLVSGQSLTLQLRRMLAAANNISDFDRLPIPFRAVATDLESGEEVVFRNGNLATAIRASMSIPGVFPPVKIGNRMLIDGGLRNNVPTDLAREMGADILIVVRIPPRLSKGEELGNMFSISSQSLTIVMANGGSLDAQGLQPGDVLIEPDMRDIGTLDFHKAAEAIARGAAATRQFDPQLAALAKMLHSFEPPQSRPPQVRLAQQQEFSIDQVAIENGSPIAPTAAIESRLTVRPGEAFTLGQLECDIARIYGTKYFGNVDYELAMEENGSQTLRLMAHPDPRGNTLMRLGLGIEEDFSGNSFYSASTDIVIRGLNDLGGEIRLFGQLGSWQRVQADWFQPLEPTQRSFIRPFLSLRGYVQPITVTNDELADFFIRELTGGVEFGRTLGDHGVFTLGAFSGINQQKLLTGDPATFAPIINGTDGLGGTYAGLKFDALDSYFLPKSGLLAEAQYTNFSELLGDEVSSDLIEARIVQAATRGNHTMIWRGEAAIDDLFSGGLLRRQSISGGFLRNSGFAKNQIIAARRAQFAAVYLRHVASVAAGRVDVYHGASAEVGIFDGAINVPDERPIVSGSLFLALDTPLGPMFAGYGMSDADSQTAFIAMGQLF